MRAVMGREEQMEQTAAHQQMGAWQEAVGKGAARNASRSWTVTGRSALQRSRWGQDPKHRTVSSSTNLGGVARREAGHWRGQQPGLQVEVVDCDGKMCIATFKLGRGRA